MNKLRIFSWRDHVMVEVEDPSADLTGWRVNVLDEVFPNVERAIDAIQHRIGRIEKNTGQKWHADSNTDLMCVVHNCLYWQCDCGSDQNVGSNTDLMCVVHNCVYWQCNCGGDRMPWSEEHLINFLGANLGKMIQDTTLKRVDEFGTPGVDMPKPFQVADCQPGGHPDSQFVNSLIVTLWNNTTFIVEIKLKPRS